MAFARLIPTNVNIPFLAQRRVATIVSALAFALSCVLIVAPGLNLGIDFRGGVLVDIETPEPPDVERIRVTLGDLGLGGDIQVQRASDALRQNAVLIRVEAQEGEGAAAETAQQRARDAVLGALSGLYPGLDESTASVEVVGPKVSGELVRAGVTAVVLALLLMLAYIWFRFEAWQYSVGAVVALVHDVVITLGVFAATGLEFNLSIIAALLTIVGYSMNDTVVLYDRIREKIRRFKKIELVELVNMAVNKTLARTLMTSLTTLLALVALFVIGGQVLRGFSFAMILGVLIGTYSSIFVAAPMLLFTGLPREALASAAEPA